MPDRIFANRTATSLIALSSALIIISACTPDTQTSKDSPPPPEPTAETTQEEADGNIAVTAEKRVRSEGIAYDMAAPQAAGGIVGYAPPRPDVQPRDTERYEDVDPNPVKVVAEDPVSTFSIDVDTASYGVMRSYLNDGNLPPKDAIRVEELVNYFNYDYDLPDSKTQPFKPAVQVYETPWNPDTQLVHIGIKGFDIPQTERPPLNLVLLLDVSGSMDQPNKLPLLKKSMRLLVNELSEQDTVSMVVYAGAAGTVLEPTKGSEKTKILAALDKLNAGGSTAGGEGIRQAYNLAEAHLVKDGVNRVMLATDGDFNVGIADPERLEDFVARKRETGVFLSVLGFGRGNYNDVMMQKLAQAGNGNAAYVDTLNEARKVLVDEVGGTLFPIAKDVKIQVEFNPAQVAEYRLIGYETRILDRTDFNNDEVDAGDIGSGHTVTALYEVTPVGSDAQLSDPLRYEPKEQGSADVSDELAFLRIRYKLPDEDVSKLIERPIGDADRLESFETAATDMKFAAAVAGLGQLVKGSTFTSDLSYDRVIEIAQSAKGDDPFGYRSEFIQLVRLAKSAAALPELENSNPGIGQ